MTNNVTVSMPLAVDQLIPHRLPMRLIDKLISVGEGEGIAEATITGDNILIGTDGTLDPASFIELIAQSYAAVQGFADLTTGNAGKMGFLVGVRRMSVVGTAAVGDRLQIRVAKVGGIEGFAVVDGQVFDNEQLIASGSLKLWIPKEPS